MSEESASLSQNASSCDAETQYAHHRETGMDPDPADSELLDPVRIRPEPKCLDPVWIRIRPDLKIVDPVHP